MKAYYKRAKAHAAVWNEKEARRDYNMVAELDPTLIRLVHREMQQLKETMKEKYWEEREQYWNKLDKMKEPGDDEEEKEEKENKKEEEEEEESLTGKVKLKELDADSLKIDAKEPGREEEELKEEKLAANEKPVGGLDGKMGANEKVEEKDWQEMLRLTMFLQKEGNFHMEEQHYDVAAEKFKEALEYVNYLQTKVRPASHYRWTFEDSFCIVNVHL